jgi:membrane-bound serine protease (ClpP class)
MRRASILGTIWIAVAAAGLPPDGIRVAAETGAARSVLVLDIKGAIGPGVTDYVRDGLAEAQRREAALVVLRMDTPGGLASSMRDIVMAMLSSPVPVAAFVAPAGARAASAGTYIVYASHLAAMAPSTHLGAATPVSLGGGFAPPRDGKDEGTARSATENKAVNDAVASIRALARLRERDPGFAERAVREAATLTATEAREQNVIEILAVDLADLLRQADGRRVRVQEREVVLALAGATPVALEPDWRARFLSVITDPNIAYILLLAGLYGLLFEVVSPGAVFPGVAGGIALLAGLYALNLLPVSYAGAGLLLLGVALMTAEAFLPSFGVLGIGGIVAFALGSVFLFPAEVPAFRLSPAVIAAATAASAAFLVLALGAAWRAHRRGVATGDAVLIGGTGQVLSWEDGEGAVQVHGERWHARSDASLHPGQRVRIARRDDLTLVVEPESDLPAPG